LAWGKLQIRYTCHDKDYRDGGSGRD